jgi:hypothetical protein
VCHSHTCGHAGVKKPVEPPTDESIAHTMVWVSYLTVAIYAFAVLYF